MTPSTDSKSKATWLRGWADCAELHGELTSLNDSSDFFPVPLGDPSGRSGRADRYTYFNPAMAQERGCHAMAGILPELKAVAAALERAGCGELLVPEKGMAAAR